MRTCVSRWERVCLSVAFVFVLSSSAVADEAEKTKTDTVGVQLQEERGSSLFENGRIAFDFATRMDAGTEDGDLDGQIAIGVDLYKVFSAKGGDVGTLTAQIYAVRLIDKEPPNPYIFDSGDDWAPQMRVIEFNYTQLTQGIFNIRAGHVFVPFGLRRAVNQTGTLRQLIMGPNLGTKVDWGASIHGENRYFGYETGAYRGSGLEYHDDDDPFLMAGRIHSGSGNMVVVGLSGLHGRILTGKGVIERTRFGLDAMATLGPVDLLTELSYGMDPKDTEVFNSIFELGVPFVDETVFTYVQGVVFMKTIADSWENQSRVIGGVRWTPLSQLTVEMEYEEPLTAFGPVLPSPQVRAQVRLRVN